jgi:hypothetical protein
MAFIGPGGAASASPKTIPARRVTTTFGTFSGHHVDREKSFGDGEPFV